MKNLLALFLLFFFSCEKVEVEADEQSFDVEIRIENQSGSDFEDVYINTNGGEFNYGTILSGDTTAYQHFDFAYSYAFVWLTVDGDTMVIQPIDYVGEQKLSSGRYTYQLDVIHPGWNGDSSLVMTLVED